VKHQILPEFKTTFIGVFNMKENISKGLRITLLVYAIVSVLSGLFHIISPQTAYAEGNAIERVMGGAMLAFALGAWLAYRESDWNKVKIVVSMLISWMVLYTVMMVWGVLTGGLRIEALPTIIVGPALAMLLIFLYIRENKLNK
jgi:hydrogenase-4 membrane subunit HyfE